MAIALERYLIPGEITDPATAYTAALGKVCTSLTKGYFREFAVQHWPEVCAFVCVALMCACLCVLVCMCSLFCCGALTV